MSVKWIGALLILFGCGGVGFSMASAYRREENELRQLLSALDYMQCELQYRLTPLPELCRQAAGITRSNVKTLFSTLAQELEDQISPDVMHCMNAAIAKNKELSDKAATVAANLGRTLGRFDLNGQLLGLESARQDCRHALEKLSANRETRLQSYQTLGICAGAAMAILFL